MQLFPQASSDQTKRDQIYVFTFFPLDSIMTVFLQGFVLVFSLILAIGAQNAFVLRAGLQGRNVFVICAFCAVSDMILVTVGINGMAAVLAPFQAAMPWVYAGAALWLAGYGGLRLRDALTGQSALKAAEGEAQGLGPSLLAAAGITWLNPHVYLDTVVLVGSVSTTLDGSEKWRFALGAYLASTSFFFTLGYGAKALGRGLTNPKIWARIDLFIALVMFWIAAGLIWAGIRV